MRRVRVSLRLRLSLIYGSMFFVTGTLLIGIIYVQTAQSVNAKYQEVKTPSSARQFPAFSGHFHINIGSGGGDLKQQLLAKDAILSQLVLTSVMTMLVLGVLTLGLGYLIAGRTLRPLRKVTATAQRLSESTLQHERIGLSGPSDEIKDLADTFDSMLDRLHRAFDSQRRFIANASHELRTPLAINRAAIEVALARPGASEDTLALARKLLVANARHERLIEGLLLLARSERELRTRTPVDLSDLAVNATEQLRPIAEKAGVTIHQRFAFGMTAGEIVLLERSVVNLMENAIKYNVRGGEVWVWTGSADGQAYLRVENTGPHVPAAEAENIFEPFRRLRADRVWSARGAGLGLSIVQAVVQAHSGTVETMPRPEGGLSITLRLPLTT